MNTDGAEGEVVRVGEISEPGNWLAHYTSAQVCFEHILPSGQLRMSPYADMRDPLENKDLLHGLGFYGDQPEWGPVYDAVVRGVNFIRGQARLLSFTRDAPLRASAAHPLFRCCWARPRMWEQYGDIHRGVALVFDRQGLEETLAEELRRRAPFYLGEVRYTPAGLADSAARTIVDDRVFDSAKRSVAVAGHLEQHHQDFYFLKTDDWATEYEYRAVVIDPEGGEVRVAYGDALRAVVVGERFPDWQVPSAVEACAAAGVELRRVKWLNQRPWPTRVTKPALDASEELD